jgi:hypothetical protein
VITVWQATSIAADRNFGLRWFRHARAQGSVGTASIVVDHPLKRDAAEVAFVQRNAKVEALAPNGSNEPFAESVCLRATNRCLHPARIPPCKSSKRASRPAIGNGEVRAHPCPASAASESRPYLPAGNASVVSTRVHSVILNGGTPSPFPSEPEHCFVKGPPSQPAAFLFYSVSRENRLQ